MIHPPYLAALRHRYRAELVLVLVQLDQVCPGWWGSIEELAEQLGTDRATLNRSLRKLERLEMVRRASNSNSGGTWLWWVKRSENDQPRPEDEPAWTVRHLSNRTLERIPMSQRWQWAAHRGVPRNTMRSFLTGGQTTLRGRWQLVATPYDRAADPAAHPPGVQPRPGAVVAEQHRHAARPARPPGDVRAGQGQ